MDRLEIGGVGVLVVLLLIAVRVPIAVALGVVSFVGIWMLTSANAAWGILTAIPHSFVSNWSLSAVPMFLLMGYVASQTGLTSGLFSSMGTLLARVPGGLASATVVASALFASASGSSAATAAAFSRIAVPEMLKAGYKASLATGSVAASGTLGILIPPSIGMILYGIFTETSIGALFIGGIIPGVLSAAIYIVMITLRVWRAPSLAPFKAGNASRIESGRALREVWPLPVLILTVLGGIFSGIVTPTEAGAIGAGAAIMIALARRSFDIRTFWHAVVDTAMGTSSIFIIVVTAAMFSVFMGLSGLPNALADVALSITDGPISLIILIGIVYIILGMFMDSIGLMLLTLPIIHPILIQMNVDMVWFGIIVIKLLEIGLITPPLGINVFVIKTSLGDRVDLWDIFKGSFWFILMDFLTLAILIAFPVITLFLPGLMM